MFGLYEKRLFEIFLNEDFKTSDTQTHTHESHQHPLTNQMAVSLLNRGESSAPTSLKVCFGDRLDDASDRKGGVEGGVWKGEADFDEQADDVDLTTTTAVTGSGGCCEVEFFGDFIFDIGAAVVVGGVTSLFRAVDGADKFPFDVELAMDNVSTP